MKQAVSPSHARPNIAIVAGMPRCGTTTLHHILDDHPRVYVPFRKETSFFTFQYERGIDWYQSLFKKMPPGSLGFDVSGNYILVEAAIERIMKFNPDVKVIVSVRDPAEVATSFYKLMYGWDPEVPPFDKFIHSYNYRFCHKRLQLQFSSGILTRMLNRWRESFGDNLLMIDFRLFNDDLLQVMQAIESFVNLPHYFTSSNLRNHRINSSNRRNSRLVSHFLSQENVISLFYKYYPETAWWFPHIMFRRMRKRVDKFRVRKGGPQREVLKIPTDQLSLAKKVFARESEEVSMLFSRHPILLGSGEPFAPTTLPGQSIRQT